MDGSSPKIVSRPLPAPEVRGSAKPTRLPRRGSTPQSIIPFAKSRSFVGRTDRVSIDGANPSNYPGLRRSKPADLSPSGGPNRSVRSRRANHTNIASSQPRNFCGSLSWFGKFFTSLLIVCRSRAASGRQQSEAYPRIVGQARRESQVHPHPISSCRAAASRGSDQRLVGTAVASSACASSTNRQAPSTSCIASIVGQSASSRRGE